MVDMIDVSNEQKFYSKFKNCVEGIYGNQRRYEKHIKLSPDDQLKMRSRLIDSLLNFFATKSIRRFIEFFNEGKQHRHFYRVNVLDVFHVYSRWT